MPEFIIKKLEVKLVLELVPWIFEIEFFLICYSF